MLQIYQKLLLIIDIFFDSVTLFIFNNVKKIGNPFRRKPFYVKHKNNYKNFLLHSLMR